jgi:arylsulfatase
MSGVNVPKAAEIRHDYFTVMDLAPTFLEIAGINYPGEHGTEKTRPMLGESMLPYLRGEKNFVHDENYVTRHEHRLRFYVRKGDWKLVNIERPLKEENFHLYNLAKDLGETTDLKTEFPNVYNDLLEEWRNYVNDAMIIIPNRE